MTGRLGTATCKEATVFIGIFHQLAPHSLLQHPLRQDSYSTKDNLPTATHVHTHWKLCQYTHMVFIKAHTHNAAYPDILLNYKTAHTQTVPS